METITIFAVFVAIVAIVLSIISAVNDFKEDKFSLLNIVLLFLSIGIVIIATILFQNL